ncbi:MAG: phage tail protein [Paucimonas sp.]|jgi:hypothetical protein|uniref:phage tail protein n=1 Tax=Pantoea sp. Cy-639 TaxID=2608360 RepID=UPI00142456FA|nr:phage tail protein [Pantoea sp. Cy-639]MDR2305701.1 phage tail protein [Paucimonas sp.]NIF19363.1 phage tail protein [Pantoea sp. Cy-639]
MNQLKALATYLLARQLVPAAQFQARTEQLDLQLAWAETEQGLHMGDLHYRALFDLHDFSGSPARLMALAGSWLEVHDPDRHRFALARPSLTVQAKDPANDLFDVSLTVEFVEPLYLAEDASGEIEVFDRTWSFIPFDLWVAEQGELSIHQPPL